MHQSSEANMIFYVILCSWVAAKTEQEHYQTQEDNRRGDSIQGVDVDWFKSNERRKSAKNEEANFPMHSIKYDNKLIKQERQKMTVWTLLVKILRF